MVAHVVLFRPKPTLTPEQRAELLAALQYALTTIPQIKRAHVGRRLSLGRPYDAANQQSFPYIAVIEFETRHDLLAYLDHPAHTALGAQFYSSSEAALAFDYQIVAPEDPALLLGDA